MKIQWKNLISCIAIPLAVGGLSALLTRNSMDAFDSIAKPDLTPPDQELQPLLYAVVDTLDGLGSLFTNA